MRGHAWASGTRLLGAVLGASLRAIAHARGIQRGADDLVAHPGKVLHPAPANEHDRVLLEVVADAGDICGDFDRRGEADASDLAKGRVRLLGRGRVDTGAHAPPLRRSPQSRRL